VNATIDHGRSVDDLLPGPETEMLWTVSEGSRHREERTEAGLCVTDDNNS